MKKYTTPEAEIVKLDLDEEILEVDVGTGSGDTGGGFVPTE